MALYSRGRPNGNAHRIERLPVEQFDWPLGGLPSPQRLLLLIGLQQPPAAIAEAAVAEAEEERKFRDSFIVALFVAAAVVYGRGQGY